VLGTIGTILWTGQILPQLWESWKTKSTEGLSGLLMFAPACEPTCTYNIVQRINIPLIIQPQLFGALAAASWCQCLYYSGRLPKRMAYLVLLVYLCLFAGFEAGMTCLIRALLAILQSFGITAAALISVGLIPQYIEIWRLGEVRGISMTFMIIDILGGVFSLLSLVFRKHFDVTASASYIAVIVLDGVVVLCRIILNPLAERRRQRSVSAEPNYDEPPIEEAATLRDGNSLGNWKAAES
ncbi:uncharacterized protein EI90DRAFT_3216685, partial [Cantharellus anzutake]|uniref:uncharacterized protein n=1 Tax=Cantharellus anzutake TaxID=1750568 RepID=UPI0019073EA3